MCVCVCAFDFRLRFPFACSSLSFAPFFLSACANFDAKIFHIDDRESFWSLKRIAAIFTCWRFYGKVSAENESILMYQTVSENGITDTHTHTREKEIVSEASKWLLTLNAK